tara:strand:- start:425 stop:871 length:447 start_codon:yes stop_codon:yes gene_type:complete
MIQVKEISSDYCIEIRNEVLWPYKNLNKCNLDEDYSDYSFHLAAYFNNELVCVGSFFKQINSKLRFLNQYRLRAMATLPKARNKGAGKALIFHACSKLEVRGQEVLWCDAREIAIKFYKKSGFNILGDSYEIPIIGTHYLMYRKLSFH